MHETHGMVQGKESTFNTRAQDKSINQCICYHSHDYAA